MSDQQLDIAALAVRALTLYSLAEFQSGNATSIHIHAANTSFVVADNGRGQAIERVVDGVPYPRLIYTHLAYPCGVTHAPAVQLQGIGMSLINCLCSELSVVARTARVTLRMHFASGVLRGEERTASTSNTTGNTVSGTVSPLHQRDSTHVQGLESWLLDVLRATPGLQLRLNDRELHAPGAG